MTTYAISQFDAFPAMKLNRGEAFAWHSALITGVLMVPTLLAYSVDVRELNDVSVWAKPLKFQFSIAIHLVTLALITTLLKPEVRNGRGVSVILSGSGLIGLMEVGYITFQAARGRASHFNNTTDFEAVAYSFMGVGANLLMIFVIVLGVLVFRYARKDVGAGLRYGSLSGLVAGGVLTAVIGGYLGAQSGHLVGGTSDASGMLLTGWSTQFGDLRVSHFFSTHMMQVLPVVGLMGDRVAGRYPVALVTVVTVVMVCVVGGTFAQALMGRALF